MGFGHIVRCVSVCEALAERGVLAELIINGDGAVSDLCKNIKSRRILNWLKNSKMLFECIQGADIAIIDSYLAPLNFYNKISRAVKTPVFFDDEKRLDYPRGIVINGAVYADKLRYRGKKNMAYLLGPCFIPLRKEFRGVAGKKIGKKVKRIMITFGGDDPKNMTSKVLKILVESYPPLVKNVVIGKGFKNRDEIIKFSDGKTRLIDRPDAAGMKKIMSSSDMAISGGGQTLYELAMTGVPTISVLVADNQLNNIVGLVRAGVVKYAGKWNSRFLKRSIKKCVCGLQNVNTRKRMSLAGKETVDGLGAVRIAKVCIERYLKENLVVKNAGPGDLMDVYKLSNDREIRSRSFNTEKIGLDEHKGWFRGKIEDDNCLFLIARLKGKFLGQIRFDKNDSGMVVNLSIAECYRGSGVGRVFMDKALSHVMERSPSVRFIKAFVKKDNIPSRGFFENAGFGNNGITSVKDVKAIEYSLDLKKIRKGIV
jgi:spore coat polysaccharide biosynthesis predicted glycosyltransferase SpsG/ribosomal protein S18 acetylase RimI-like enzyme